MKRYACFRYGEMESWWEMLEDPPSLKARQIYHSEDGAKVGVISFVRYNDDDCEKHDELPDRVLAEITKRQLLGSC